MPRIIVKYYGTLRDLTHKIEESIDGDVLGDIIDKIVSKYGNSFRNESPLIIYNHGGNIGHFVIIDGHHYNELEGSNTKLKDDDLVNLFVPVAGG